MPLSALSETFAPLGAAVIRVIEQAALAAAATDTTTALRLALLASELRRTAR